MKAGRRTLLILSSVLTILIAGGVIYWKVRSNTVSNKGKSENGIQLSEKKYDKAVSDIFVVEGTGGEEKGVNTLFRNMADNGLKIYKSDKDDILSGKNGFIAKDDVVLIKINSQWDSRGGTNTDLVKSAIEAIINHPDSFNGEIVVADNGQAQYGGNGNGGSMQWENNNAKDRSQSIQKVVDGFQKKAKVSAFLWDNITQNKVGEYSDGNYEDGFVIASDKDAETGIVVSYAKFKTDNGTYMSRLRQRKKWIIK